MQLIKKIFVAALIIFGLSILLITTPFGIIAAAYIGASTGWFHVEDYMCSDQTDHCRYHGPVRPAHQ